MEDQYLIIAQDRATKKRVAITQPMPQEAAKSFVPPIWMKRAYKYFRVAKHRPPPENTGNKNALSKP